MGENDALHGIWFVFSMKNLTVQRYLDKTFFFIEALFATAEKFLKRGIKKITRNTSKIHHKKLVKSSTLIEKKEAIYIC